MAKNNRELLDEIEKLKKENQETLMQLRELEETIDLIKTGNIDALVIAGKKDLKVYTEKTADKTYRLLIEKMHEGAVTLNPVGTILYCNTYFANMVNLPLQKVIGKRFKNFVEESSKEHFEIMLKQSREDNIKEEVCINASDGKIIPVLIAMNSLSLENNLVLSVILTDLSIQKENQRELRINNELLEEAEKIAEIGSWVVELGTRKVTLSREFYRIYGLDPIKDSGKLSPEELIHQNDPDVSKIIFETTVKNLGSFDTFTRINIPGINTEKTLHVKGNVISKNGKALRVIGTSQDVTALMKAEKELKDYNKELLEAQENIEKLNESLESTVKERTKELELSRQHFKFLTDHIPQMAWTADVDGTVDYYNAKWHEYTGVVMTNAQETGWEDILWPADLAKVNLQWKASIETGKVYEEEFRIKCERNNEYRWHLCRALPLKDETGKIVKWFGTCTDIEEQKKSMEQKDEFIGIASHELRTPITSLKAYIQLLERDLKDKNNPQANQYVLKSRELVEKLNSLVTELHEVTKIQAGKFQLHKSEFNFDEFLEDTIESIQISTGTHQISKKGEANIVVSADKQRLQQVLFNYLTNAVKYSPKESEVIVNVNVEKKLLTVGVKDFGLGIPEDEIAKVFSRFFRSTNTKNIEGLGLGLYLCKQIIKAHKGEVWVESKQGKGSTFFFTLPI